jgi:hypothetical protein
MSDVDIIADLIASIEQAKDYKKYPLALPNALDIEKELRAALARLDRFRKNRRYRYALQSSLKIVEDRVRQGSKISKEDLIDHADLDWHKTNKRYLRMLVTEWNRAEVQKIVGGRKR